MEKPKLQEEPISRDVKLDAPGLTHPCVAELTEWVEDELPGAGDHDEVKRIQWAMPVPGGSARSTTPPLPL